MIRKDGNNHSAYMYDTEPQQEMEGDDRTCL